MLRLNLHTYSFQFRVFNGIYLINDRLRPRTTATTINFHSRSQKPKYTFMNNKNVKCYQVVKDLLLDIDNKTNLKEMGALGLRKSEALTRALKGAWFSQDYEGFILIFNKWWAKMYDSFNGLDAHKISDLIRYLGKINQASQGKLRQKLTIGHLQVIETQFLDTEDEIKNWDTKYYKLLFEGYFRLSSLRDYYSAVRLPGSHVISKCLNSFPAVPDKNSSNESFPNLKYEHNFCSTVHFLSHLRVFPPHGHINFIIQQFERIFDSTLSNYSRETDKKFELYVSDYCYLLDIYAQIADIFISYRLNPDQIKPDFWQRWFHSVKCLMELESIYSVKEIKLIQKSKGCIFTYKMTYLIDRTFKVASKFDKIDDLLGLKSLISEILTKRVRFSHPFCLHMIHTSLQSAEIAFKVKLLDKSFAQKTSKRLVVLKNNAMISEMAGKIEKYIKHKNNVLSLTKVAV